MIRPASRDEILPGSEWWAYAAGWWRRVRVEGPAPRKKIRVHYYVQATRTATPTVRVQDLPLCRFRADAPVGVYGIVHTPAPPTRPAGAAA